MLVNIYAIDRDNGEGRYERRHGFGRFFGPTNVTDDRGLVLYQDTDGGQVTEITAPDDAQFRRTKGDEIALFVPGCEIGLSADDVLALARDCRFGLRIA